MPYSMGKKWYILHYSQDFVCVFAFMEYKAHLEDIIRCLLNGQYAFCFKEIILGY